MMGKLPSWLAVFGLTLASVSNVEACNKCGIFGRGCRFANVVASHVDVAPVAVVQRPEVFVVQNNYPQGNGVAANLAQQGNTVYGYQAAALQSYVDPSAVLQQAAELARAAGQTAQLGLNGFNSTAQLQLGLQAQNAQPLIKSAAAAQVLNAAGLNQPAAFTAPQQLSLKLVFDPSTNQWKIENVPTEQLQSITKSSQQLNANVKPQPTQPEVGPQPAPQSLIALKCGKCHGTQLTEPKAGIFLSGADKLECKTVLASLRSIRDNKMPKGESLTPEEKGRLMEELLALSKE